MINKSVINHRADLLLVKKKLKNPASSWGKNGLIHKNEIKKMECKNLIAKINPQFKN
jgi:hypothetical protein